MSQQQSKVAAAKNVDTVMREERAVERVVKDGPVEKDTGMLTNNLIDKKEEGDQTSNNNDEQTVE